LAARYDAPACRSAMRRMLDPTGAFAGSRWAKTSRNWVQQDGALYNGTILYVRNQKVGSEMIMSSARHSPLGPQTMVRTRSCQGRPGRRQRTRNPRASQHVRAALNTPRRRRPRRFEVAGVGAVGGVVQRGEVQASKSGN
jgi:hypothetical protein